MAKAEHIDADYALVKVAQIDERLAALDAEKALLTDKRKFYAPHTKHKPHTEKAAPAKRTAKS